MRHRRCYFCRRCHGHQRRRCCHRCSLSQRCRHHCSPSQRCPGRQRFILSCEETSSSGSNEKSSVDEESSSPLLSSIILCFFIDVVDSSESSSPRSRLMSLEAIIFSVMKSVVHGSYLWFIWSRQRPFQRGMYDYSMKRHDASYSSTVATSIDFINMAHRYYGHRSDGQANITIARRCCAPQ
jgi:hypothetical protein